MTHLFHDQGRGVLVDGLVDRRHNAQAHERLDDFASLDCHTRGKLSDGDHFPDLNFSGDKFFWLKLTALLIDLQGNIALWCASFRTAL